jgi:hypothetical protein
VSVGKQINREELEAIVSENVEDNIHSVERFDQLAGISDRIVAGLCNGKERQQ